MEEDTCVWRRILVCAGGYLCVEEDACVWRRILVCGGGYLCVEEDTGGMDSIALRPSADVDVRDNAKAASLT